MLKQEYIYEVRNSSGTPLKAFELLASAARFIDSGDYCFSMSIHLVPKG